MGLKNYTFLFIFILSSTFGKVIAQGFPFPQFYPNTYDDPRVHESDIQRLAPPVQAPIPMQAPMPAHRIPQTLPGRRVYYPETNSGWFYTKEAYDQALQRSRDEQRRLYQEAYPND